MGDFLLIQTHSPCSPPFPFYYLAKQKDKDTKEEKEDGGTVKTKVSNTGGILLLLLIQIHSPCTMYLPHFLFIILQMKGMNLDSTETNGRDGGDR